MKIQDLHSGSDLVIDPLLIRKHDVSGPRYTSYPTADRFNDRFDEGLLRSWLGRRSAAVSKRPWSIYMHLPFCDTLCFYCACNKIITRDHSKSRKYVDYLERELSLHGPLLEKPQICQLHWGGGTPTFLARDEMRRLIAAIARRFERTADFE